MLFSSHRSARPSPVPRTPRNAPPARQAPAAPPEPAHEHGWIAESRHRTSEGVCVYVRCADCGARRMDLQAHAGLPPVGRSIELGGRAG
ncbi:hypothetical protein D3248_04630 [Leucobacter zeae]|nr:hypothetical protein [Leucobacter zeae]